MKWFFMTRLIFMELLFWCFLILFIFLGAEIFVKGLYNLVNDGFGLEFLGLFISGTISLIMAAFVGNLHFKAQEQEKIKKEGKIPESIPESEEDKKDEDL